MDSLTMPAAALHAELLTTPERFAELEPEWDALMEAAGIAHPFMSHPWLFSWWECFGEQAGELRIILVREDRRLIAAAPMVLYKTRLYGIPVRCLGNLYNDHTPRAEFPICSRHQEACALIWRTMAAINCDAIICKQFPRDCPGLADLRRHAESEHWLTGMVEGAREPYITLTDDHEKVLQRMSSKQRYNVRKRYKDLHKLGEVELEEVSSTELLEQALQDGFEMEAAAWKGDAGTAMLSDPAVHEFYSRLARRAMAHGWLRLAFLKLNGRRMSFNYLLDYNDTVYGVKIGYDPEYRPYSPGHALLIKLLEQACARGFTEYDFLGDDDSWKLAWTDRVRYHEWLFLFRGGVRGRLLHAAKFHLGPKVKDIFTAMANVWHRWRTPPASASGSSNPKDK